MFLNKHDPCGFSQGEADTKKKKKEKKEKRKGRALDNDDTFASDTKRREEAEEPFTLRENKKASIWTARCVAHI